MKQGAHLTKPGWSKPHTHSNPTKLSLFRRKIALYRFNQGDRLSLILLQGASNGSRGAEPPTPPPSSLTLTTSHELRGPMNVHVGYMTVLTQSDYQRHILSSVLQRQPGVPRQKKCERRGCLWLGKLKAFTRSFTRPRSQDVLVLRQSPWRCFGRFGRRSVCPSQNTKFATVLSYPPLHIFLSVLFLLCHI